MNKKLKVVIKVLDKVVNKYPETKDYKENNMKENCDGKARQWKRTFISLVF